MTFYHPDGMYYYFDSSRIVTQKVQMSFSDLCKM